MIDALFLMRIILNSQSKANQKKNEKKKFNIPFYSFEKGKPHKQSSNNKKEFVSFLPFFITTFFPFNFDHIFFAF